MTDPERDLPTEVVSALHSTEPTQSLQALSELAQGQSAAALARWQRLEARQAVDFHCARWRDAIHCLAADLWVQGEAVARHAPAMVEQLMRQLLPRLASRVVLLHALACDGEGLAQWLDDSAGHDLIDALWLAPRRRRH